MLYSEDKVKIKLISSIFFLQLFTNLAINQKEIAHGSQNHREDQEGEGNHDET